MLGGRLAGRLALTGLFFVGTLAIAVLPPFPPAWGGAGGCDVPDELMQVDDKLPHLAERLRAGEPVKIVAIGGASTTRLAAGFSGPCLPHPLDDNPSRLEPSPSIHPGHKGGAPAKGRP